MYICICWYSFTLHRFDTYIKTISFWHRSHHWSSHRLLWYSSLFTRMVNCWKTYCKNQGKIFGQIKKKITYLRPFFSSWLLNTNEIYYKTFHTQNSLIVRKNDTTFAINEHHIYVYQYSIDHAHTYILYIHIIYKYYRFSLSMFFFLSNYHSNLNYSQK